MLARRIDGVSQRMNESRLQGFLVTFLPNIRYLTGFTGSNAILFLRDGEGILITDNRYSIQASAEVKGVRTAITSGSLLEFLSGNRTVARRGKIGFESNTLTVAAFNKLRKILRGSQLIPTIGFIEGFRERKDANEISKIACAVEITDRVFNKILAILKPGIKELEVAAEITYWHRAYGAESEAFDPIVASGIRGALPHGRASEKALRKGEMVTLDMGCKVDGYHSDLTRTVCLGKPQGEMRGIYRVVLDAQKKALDCIVAGIPARKADRAARSHIAKSGYGRFFSHSLGHGLGLEVHEKPRVSGKTEEILQEDSVVTIEPGIYIPRLGGVRIEDDVVVRKDGCEILNKAPKGLMIL